MKGKLLEEGTAVGVEDKSGKKKAAARFEIYPLQVGGLEKTWVRFGSKGLNVQGRIGCEISYCCARKVIWRGTYS